LCNLVLGNASIAISSHQIGLKSYARNASQRITNRMQVLQDVWIVWYPVKKDAEVMLPSVMGSKQMRKVNVWIVQQRPPTGQKIYAGRVFQRIISRISPGKNALIAVIPVKLTHRYWSVASASLRHRKCLSFEEDYWRERSNRSVICVWKLLKQKERKKKNKHKKIKEKCMHKERKTVW